MTKNYILVDGNGGKVPQDLRDKVNEITRQYEIDQILNMPEYTFFCGLDDKTRASDGYSTFDPTPYRKQIEGRKWIIENAHRIWQ